MHYTPEKNIKIHSSHKMTFASLLPFFIMVSLSPRPLAAHFFIDRPGVDPAAGIELFT
jgi:hypothetical protein